MNDDTPNYYGIIPAPVRYDNKLPDGAKILFSEIRKALLKTSHKKVNHIELLIKVIIIYSKIIFIQDS